MYFPDLSEYSYWTERPFPNVKTVGWIEPEHAFEKGVIDADVVGKLKKMMFMTKKVNIHARFIRGTRACKFCGEYDAFFESEPILGSSEIWIPDLSDGFYAAPSEILHYIEFHSYRPPEEYIRAVREFDLDKNFDAETEYKKLKDRYAMPE